MPSIDQSISKQIYKTNMEAKSLKNSNILLCGLSFNLIPTLGSLGFACYSLHRLDSRLTAVERDLLVINRYPYRLANRMILEPTSSSTSANTHSTGSLLRKRVVKRAVRSSPSKCRKCRSVCSNSNRHRNVSLYKLLLLPFVLNSCEGVFVMQITNYLLNSLNYFLYQFKLKGELEERHFTACRKLISMPRFYNNANNIVYPFVEGQNCRHGDLWNDQGSS